MSLLDNLAVETVQGYDLTARYDLDIGDWGQLSFSDILSLTSTWDRQELLGALTVDCAGHWGATCGSSVPDVRNHFRLTWLTRWRVRPSLTRRYISAADGLNATAIDLGARHYVDVSARWDYSDSLRAGINNLFDRPPPIAGAAAGPSHFGNGYTFPDLYDALGRYAFMAVSVVLP